MWNLMSFHSLTGKDAGGRKDGAGGEGDPTSAKRIKNIRTLTTTSMKLKEKFE